MGGCIKIVLNVAINTLFAKIINIKSLYLLGGKPIVSKKQRSSKAASL